MAPTDPEIAPPTDDRPVTGPSSPATTILSCPYLTSSSRAWVASAPSGDHRCEAVAPPAALSAEKQRRLCLTANHQTCATYLAALEARETRASGSVAEPTGWGWVRTTPVVDGSVGLGASVAALVTERRAWQVIPAVALVAALGALGLSNIGSGPSGASPRPSGPVALASPTQSGQTASASPTPPGSPGLSPTPEASQAPLPTASPTIGPTVPPIATPAPSARTTYTVKSGDTLYNIARNYGTTVAAIKALNGLTTNTLHAGQVLKIP